MSILSGAWEALHRRPFGKRLFSAAVCVKAPYFIGILPRVVSLEPGRGVVRIPDWWGVHNHIGTVHAIACCNLAEFVGAATIDLSLPASHRWIPKGMAVEYRAKAKGPLTGTATVEDLTGLATDESRDVVVGIDITDPGGTVVVRADITMWISPSRQR